MTATWRPRSNSSEDACAPRAMSYAAAVARATARRHWLSSCRHPTAAPCQVRPSSSRALRCNLRLPREELLQRSAEFLCGRRVREGGVAMARWYLDGGENVAVLHGGHVEGVRVLLLVLGKGGRHQCGGAEAAKISAHRDLADELVELGRHRIKLAVARPDAAELTSRTGIGVPVSAHA
jgi:hypothetical protein